MVEQFDQTTGETARVPLNANAGVAAGAVRFPDGEG